MQHLRKKRMAQLCCAAPPRPLEGQASCRRCGSRLGKEVHCHAHPRRAGLRIFVHTQMGAEFKILFLIVMQIVDPRAPQARSLMQVDSFETD